MFIHPRLMFIHPRLMFIPPRLMLIRPRLMFIPPSRKGAGGDTRATTLPCCDEGHRVKGKAWPIDNSRPHGIRFAVEYAV
jgi:hypothetical protein